MGYLLAITKIFYLCLLVAEISVCFCLTCGCCWKYICGRHVRQSLSEELQRNGFESSDSEDVEVGPEVLIPVVVLHSISSISRSENSLTEEWV